MLSYKLYVLLFLIVTVTKSATTDKKQTAVRSVSDSPILVKILQSVDAASSDDHLFEVTLKLLKSLCVCMHETLKENGRSKIFYGDTNSLQIDDESHESDGKVLELYTKIYNNTCLNLRQELATKLNRIHDTFSGNDKDLMKNSNCGKKMDFTTENVIPISSSLLPTVQNDLSSELKEILFETLILTQPYHKYTIRRYNLFKKSDPQLEVENSKHSIIVIITLQTARSVNKTFEDSPTISKNEINNTLYSKSSIDIDIIDTKYGSDVEESIENVKTSIASECNLQSIYFFLVETEKRNFTKVFKVLKRKGTIKIYIDVVTMRNHCDYSKICCADNGKTICDNALIKDEIISKKVSKMNDNNTTEKRMDALSKIKALVKLYDEQLQHYNNNIVSDSINKTNAAKPVSFKGVVNIKHENDSTKYKQKKKDLLVFEKIFQGKGKPIVSPEYKYLSFEFDKTLKTSEIQKIRKDNLFKNFQHDNTVLTALGTYKTNTVTRTMSTKFDQANKGSRAQNMLQSNNKRNYSNSFDIVKTSPAIVTSNNPKNYYNEKQESVKINTFNYNNISTTILEEEQENLNNNDMNLMVLHGEPSYSKYEINKIYLNFGDSKNNNSTTSVNKTLNSELYPNKGNTNITSSDYITKQTIPTEKILDTYSTAKNYVTTTNLRKYVKTNSSEDSSNYSFFVNNLTTNNTQLIDKNERDVTKIRKHTNQYLKILTSTVKYDINTDVNPVLSEYSVLVQPTQQMPQTTISSGLHSKIINDGNVYKKKITNIDQNNIKLHSVKPDITIFKGQNYTDTRMNIIATTKHPILETTTQQGSQTYFHKNSDREDVDTVIDYTYKFTHRNLKTQKAHKEIQENIFLPVKNHTSITTIFLSTTPYQQSKNKDINEFKYYTNVFMNNPTTFQMGENNSLNMTSQNESTIMIGNSATPSASTQQAAQNAFYMNTFVKTDNVDNNTIPTKNTLISRLNNLQTAIPSKKVSQSVLHAKENLKNTYEIESDLKIKAHADYHFKGVKQNMVRQDVPSYVLPIVTNSYIAGNQIIRNPISLQAIQSALKKYNYPKATANNPPSIKNHKEEQDAVWYTEFNNTKSILNRKPTAYSTQQALQNTFTKNKHFEEATYEYQDTNMTEYPVEIDIDPTKQTIQNTYVYNTDFVQVHENKNKTAVTIGIEQTHTIDQNDTLLNIITPEMNFVLGRPPQKIFQHLNSNLDSGTFQSNEQITQITEHGLMGYSTANNFFNNKPVTAESKMVLTTPNQQDYKTFFFTNTYPINIRKHTVQNEKVGFTVQNDIETSTKNYVHLGKLTATQVPLSTFYTNTYLKKMTRNDNILKMVRMDSQQHLVKQEEPIQTVQNITEYNMIKTTTEQAQSTKTSNKITKNEAEMVINNLLRNIKHSDIVTQSTLNFRIQVDTDTKINDDTVKKASQKVPQYTSDLDATINKYNSKINTMYSNSTRMKQVKTKLDKTSLTTDNDKITKTFLSLSSRIPSQQESITFYNYTDFNKIFNEDDYRTKNVNNTQSQETGTNIDSTNNYVEKSIPIKTSFGYATKNNKISIKNQKIVTPAQILPQNNTLPNITTKTLNQIYSSIVSPTKQQIKRLVSGEERDHFLISNVTSDYYKQLEEYDDVGLKESKELQVLDTNISATTKFYTLPSNSKFNINNDALKFLDNHFITLNQEQKTTTRMDKSEPESISTVFDNIGTFFKVSERLTKVSLSKIPSNLVTKSTEKYTLNYTSLVNHHSYKNKHSSLDYSLYNNVAKTNVTTEPAIYPAKSTETIPPATHILPFTVLSGILQLRQTENVKSFESQDLNLVNTNVSDLTTPLSSTDVEVQTITTDHKKSFTAPKAPASITKQLYFNKDNVFTVLSTKQQSINSTGKLDDKLHTLSTTYVQNHNTHETPGIFKQVAEVEKPTNMKIKKTIGTKPDLMLQYQQDTSYSQFKQNYTKRMPKLTTSVHQKHDSLQKYTTLQQKTYNSYITSKNVYFLSTKAIKGSKVNNYTHEYTTKKSLFNERKNESDYSLFTTPITSEELLQLTPKSSVKKLPGPSNDKDKSPRLENLKSHERFQNKMKINENSVIVTSNLEKLHIEKSLKRKKDKNAFNKLLTGKKGIESIKQDFDTFYQTKEPITFFNITASVVEYITKSITSNPQGFRSSATIPTKATILASQNVATMATSLYPLMKKSTDVEMNKTITKEERMTNYTKLPKNNNWITKNTLTINDSKLNEKLPFIDTYANKSIMETQITSPVTMKNKIGLQQINNTITAATKLTFTSKLETATSQSIKTLVNVHDIDLSQESNTAFAPQMHTTVAMPSFKITSKLLTDTSNIDNSSKDSIKLSNLIENVTVNKKNFENDMTVEPIFTNFNKNTNDKQQLLIHNHRPRINKMFVRAKHISHIKEKPASNISLAISKFNAIPMPSKILHNNENTNKDKAYITNGPVIGFLSKNISTERKILLEENALIMNTNNSGTSKKISSTVKSTSDTAPAKNNHQNDEVFTYRTMFYTEPTFTSQSDLLEYDINLVSYNPNYTHDVHVTGADKNKSKYVKQFSQNVNVDHFNDQVRQDISKLTSTSVTKNWIANAISNSVQNTLYENSNGRFQTNFKNIQETSNNYDKNENTKGFIKANDRPILLIDSTSILEKTTPNSLPELYQSSIEFTNFVTEKDNMDEDSRKLDKPFEKKIQNTDLQDNTVLLIKSKSNKSETIIPKCSTTNPTSPLTKNKHVTYNPNSSTNSNSYDFGNSHTKSIVVSDPLTIRNLFIKNNLLIKSLNKSYDLATILFPTTILPISETLGKVNSGNDKSVPQLYSSTETDNLLNMQMVEVTNANIIETSNEPTNQNFKTVNDRVSSFGSSVILPIEKSDDFVNGKTGALTLPIKNLTNLLGKQLNLKSFLIPYSTERIEAKYSRPQLGSNLQSVSSIVEKILQDHNMKPTITGKSEKLKSTNKYFLETFTSLPLELSKISLIKVQQEKNKASSIQINRLLVFNKTSTGSGKNMNYETSSPQDVSEETFVNKINVNAKNNIRINGQNATHTANISNILTNKNISNDALKNDDLNKSVIERHTKESSLLQNTEDSFDALFNKNWSDLVIERKFLKMLNNEYNPKILNDVFKPKNSNKTSNVQRYQSNQHTLLPASRQNIVFEKSKNKKENPTEISKAGTKKNENNNLLKNNIKYVSIQNSITKVASNAMMSAKTTKTIKYNTYRPTTEDLDGPMSLEARIKLLKKVISTANDKLTFKGSQNSIQIKNTPACALLRNLSHYGDPNLKSFTELVKASNCSEVTAPIVSSRNKPVKYVGHSNKIITKNYIYFKSNITKNKLLDPFVKTKLFPVKIVSPKNQRKIMRRIQLGGKNKEIMTMNTGEFFSRRKFMTQRNIINNAFQIHPESINMRLLKPTSAPKHVVLRPKFDRVHRANYKPKPLMYDNNFQRDDYQTHRRSNAFSWRDNVNFMQDVHNKKELVASKDNVLARPFALEPSNKPKFLRDRVNSIRNYLVNTDFVKTTTQRDYFLDSPLESSIDVHDDDDDDKIPQPFLIPLKKNIWIPEEVLTTSKRPRRTRPRRTIFFLSPTVPYNRYF